MGILVMGSLHHDVVVRAPRLPAPGETLLGSGVAYDFGGKGGNQAVAAAAAGADVSMAGRVGRDAAGDVLLEELDRAGVERSRVFRAEGATGMSVAIVEKDGENAAVVVSGVNRGVAGDDFDLPDALSSVMLQSEVPVEANLALAARLPDGVRLILNAAPAGPLPEALLRRVDVLVVNSVEAEMLAGRAAPADMAAWLRGLGPGCVILTLGGDGVVVDAGAEAFTMPAEQVAVVSTHGAGDVFCGTLAARIDAGDGLRLAITVAQSAAAQKVAGGAGPLS